MFVGTHADLSDLLKTAPWGMEQMVASAAYACDGESGWSVLILVDPEDDESEGIVYAYSPDRSRAVIVGLAKAKTARAAQSVIHDTEGWPELRTLASLLQRSDTSGLIGY